MYSFSTRNYALLLSIILYIEYVIRSLRKFITIFNKNFCSITIYVYIYAIDMIVCSKKDIDIIYKNI